MFRVSGPGLILVLLTMLVAVIGSFLVAPKETARVTRDFLDPHAIRVGLRRPVSALVIALTFLIFVLTAGIGIAQFLASDHWFILLSTVWGYTVAAVIAILGCAVVYWAVDNVFQKNSKARSTRRRAKSTRA